MVSVLYHEAKRRKMPMTKLTDDLLRQALDGSESWQQSLRVAEAAPPYPAPPDAA
jgi:hypothetical protein